MTRDPRIGVLFVCLGNICRSPTAEGVFRHFVEQRGAAERFEIDSCGTGGWHAGNPADARARRAAERRGIRLASRARQLEPATDFERFDLILAMDRSNERDLLDAGGPRERVRLMRSFDPTAGADPEVPDPYYGHDDSGFELVLDQLERACTGLLDDLLA